MLLSFGLDVEESRLRDLCDCSAFGTSALRAVEAARLLGFARTAKHNLTPAEIEVCVARGELPIVFVNTLPIGGIKGEHALVLIEMSQQEVAAYDPLLGERNLPRDTFDAAWTIMRGLTILVRR